MNTNADTPGANAATGDPTPQTPAEKSVAFVNATVLAPPKATPMTGAAEIMKDQAEGMMVQDLQSFLKGFEQLGLIAISRLANNILTYGTYYHNPSSTGSKSSEEEMAAPDTGQGNEAIRDLFKIVGDYAEIKARISSGNPVSNTGTQQVQDSPSSHQPDDDPEKKND
ncbi:hypothetical protein [Chryseobacterium sp. CT-SW4]|uniref:hypothetical protein n=1 Tax=Chryseobacterium sp. SW-1 TaxID=3157343 RepID=UPI003B0208E7